MDEILLIDAGEPAVELIAEPEIVMELEPELVLEPEPEPILELIPGPEPEPQPEPGPACADVTLTARVQAEGSELRAGQFTFCVYDGGGKEAARAANGRDGIVAFPALRLSVPGTYRFNICQPTPSGFGWIIDRGCFPVAVILDGAGGARAEAPNGEALFVNRRSPSRRRV